MKLESPSSITGVTQQLHNESRAEWSGRSNLRSDRMTRAHSLFMEAMEMNAAQDLSPAISGIAETAAAPARGSRVQETREDGTGLLRNGLASASTTELTSSNSNAASDALRSPSAEAENPGKHALIHTPFGTFDADSIDKRICVDVSGSCPMEVYFVTHAPGEWMRNAARRIEFEEIYGAEALHTVICHGTVPNNIDSVWVTKPAAEPTSGRA